MNLKITQLNFELVVSQKLLLREHPESAFRGAFGQELRGLACLAGDSGCPGCAHDAYCAYAQIFEPVLTEVEKSQTSRGFSTKPRPYIIEVQNNRQTEYLPGDRMNLQFRFFGDVKRFLPFIIGAVEQVGRTGLGAAGGKFGISEIWQTNLLTGVAERIYSEYRSKVLAKDIHMEFSEVLPIVQEMPADRLRIRLLTPMLLKADGRYVERLEFDILMRNLFRRLTSLFLFYGDGEFSLDFAALLEQAKQVKLVQESTSWENWSRFSNRQSQRVEMAGLVGEVSYEGDLGVFLPYLVFGQYCYVGKNTVFGEGNYKIIAELT